MQCRTLQTTRLTRQLSSLTCCADIQLMLVLLPLLLLLRLITITVNNKCTNEPPVYYEQPRLQFLMNTAAAADQTHAKHTQH
jgi:hypothetical protein